MGLFRDKSIQLLIATDVAARGIDVTGITHVINYELPNVAETYVHRIGRTARAASEGTAYTFITEKEQQKFARIEKLLGKEVTKVKVPEQFGPTPAYSPKTTRPEQRRRFSGKPSNSRR